MSTDHQGGSPSVGVGSATHWVGAAIGAAMVGYATWRLLQDITNPVNLAKFVLGAGVAHDAILAPIVVLAGWVTARALPVPARLPVRLGLALSGLLTLFTWPLIRGYVNNRRNPSIVPLDYVRSFWVTLAILWVGVAIAIGVRLRNDRNGPREQA